MSKDIESKIGSTVYARLQAIPMSEADRLRAVKTLHDAELLADAFMWVAKKIERLGERLFLKPALKH